VICALLPSRQYEEKFDREFMRHVRDGDVAWDIGANRGLYARKLSRRCGKTGLVEAFEPSARTMELLRESTDPLGNVRLHQIALGGHDGTAALSVGADELGATTTAWSCSAPPPAGVELLAPMAAGDSLIERAVARSPDVIKIDVEGAELDCLIGLRKTLGRRRVRVWGIEVHFGLLAARGQSGAPREIESMLQGAGYGVLWTDRSHIIATRLATAQREAESPSVTNDQH
jgi:FkbM family methyltransferase